jgi:hypothetical protein
VSNAHIIIILGTSIAQLEQLEFMCKFPRPGRQRGREGAFRLRLMDTRLAAGGQFPCPFTQRFAGPLVDC